MARTPAGRAAQNAKVIDVDAMKEATGTVTYCTGKDTTGETKEWSRRFNEKYEARGLSVRIVEFPASADEQRTQFVQRQEAKAADCDVFRADVIWTAEFASQGWLYDLGDPAFMRNWPYAYGLSQDTGALKGRFAVAPLPEYEGAGRAGVLGGGNSVISVFSKNPGGALAVVDLLASQDWQTTLTAEFTQGSPMKATYDQPEVQKAIPFHAELRQAVEQARPRPVSPVYPQISQAIYDNVNRALSGQTSPEEAMKQAQADIEEALATF